MTWCVLGGAVTGAAVGALLWRWVRAGTYRRSDDVPRLQLRHAWTVMLLAAGGGAVAGTAPASLRAAAWLYLVIGAAIVWIDLDVHRVPDAITRWWAPAVAAGVLAGAALTGRWDLLGWAAVGAAALGVLFLVLALVSSMGLGDVKLAAVTGMVLGPLGWSGMATATLATFLLPALFAAALLLRGAGRNAHLAFGPGIVAGAAIALALTATTV